jgi:hypothetical protein
VTPYNAHAQQMMTQMAQGLAAAGMEQTSATRAGLAALAGFVHGQAALLSYLHAFRVFGAIFIVAVPFLFLLKRPTSSRRPVAAH